MATLTVNCGGFRKSSVGGNTAYGSLVNFSIPAGAGITGCTVTFTTHAATGTTADRAFSINGVRAHSGWANTGISLNAGLLSPGNNTFRVTLRSTGGATESCFWDISNITLHITYTEGGGSGGGGSTGGGGPVVISPSSINAGAGSVTVTCPAEGGVWHMIDWSFGTKSGQWSHPWEAGGTGTINIPLSWASEMPNATKGTLAIRVRRSNTPAMPYTYISDVTTNVTINVPASVVPSIGSFGASRIVNNTPAGISGYVQNVSGVSLAMSSVSGAYGSTISAYKITGAGRTFNASSGSIPVLSISGNIAFTAEVTDSRGRKATKVVGIDVLAYKAVSASNIAAYRSDANKNKADEGVFATLRAKMVIGSLDGQNTGTIKGRVYEKGTAPGGWTTMANDTLVLFGGSLSIEKVYTADILVADLITSYQYSIDIPTATVTMGVAPNGDGVSFGTFPETGKVKSAWPIVAPGIPPNPNILHNWDFRNPINQRGALTASGAGYWLDRWTFFTHTTGATYTYNSSWGLRAITTTTYIIMRQYIENPNAYAGKTVTLSVDIDTASVTASCTMRVWYNGITEIGTGIVINNGDTGIKSITATIPDTALTDLSVVFYNYDGNDVRIKSVKLELGTVSTLHLDPPMDYGTELAKCLRFFQHLGEYPGVYGYSGNAVTSGTLYLDLPCAMRITPTISASTATLVMDSLGSGVSGTIGSITMSKTGRLRIAVTYTGGSKVHPIGGYLPNNTTLNADL